MVTGQQPLINEMNCPTYSEQIVLSVFVPFVDKMKNKESDMFVHHSKEVVNKTNQQLLLLSRLHQPWRGFIAGPVLQLEML